MREHESDDDDEDDNDDSDDSEEMYVTTSSCFYSHEFISIVFSDVCFVVMRAVSYNGSHRFVFIL